MVIEIVEVLPPAELGLEIDVVLVEKKLVEILSV